MEKIDSNRFARPKHHAIMCYKICIDILNRLNKDYECDGRTDWPTDRRVAVIAQFTDPH